MSQNMRTESFHLLLKDVQLRGDLTVPPESRGLVIFAQGTGNSRIGPRDRLVASLLQQARIATLLFDLLSPQEENADEYSGHLRFNIRLLTQRLVAATRALEKTPSARGLCIGYFGAGTGAAAALCAAAELPDVLKAVVSRGGRPDLARDALPRVRAPTLLIVGGEDSAGLAFNRAAMPLLTVPRKLEVVPGASPFFDETGALEEVARMARRWFENNFQLSAHTTWMGNFWPREA